MNAVYVQRGDYVDFTPNEDVFAGDIVAQNRLVGIAKLDIKANELGALATSGVYDVTKGNASFTVGEKVYWKTDEKQAVKEGGVLLGLCVMDAEASDTSVRVLLKCGCATTSTSTGDTSTSEEPSGAIDDLALASVTSDGRWTGGEGNINEVTDLVAIKDRINAILIALRSHNIIGE